VSARYKPSMGPRRWPYLAIDGAHSRPMAARAVCAAEATGKKVKVRLGILQTAFSQDATLLSARVPSAPLCVPSVHRATSPWMAEVQKMQGNFLCLVQPTSAQGRPGACHATGGSDPAAHTEESQNQQVSLLEMNHQKYANLFEQLDNQEEPACITPQAAIATIKERIMKLWVWATTPRRRKLVGFIATLYGEFDLWVRPWRCSLER